MPDYEGHETITEAEGAAKIAAKPAVFTPAIGAVEIEALPPGWTTAKLDHEYLLDTPRRAKGTVVLSEADSFGRYVCKHGDSGVPGTEAVVVATMESPTGLYADVDHATITAVLNGHVDLNTPGWGDHRAVLQLHYTPELKHWISQDRQWIDQLAFAEHIEEGLGEIIDPPAADLLELAQTMSANNKVEWKSQQILANGQRQFTYHETVEAKAGQKGTVAIPQRFRIGLAVFEGQTEGYPIEARFQFRITADVLKIRYLLTKPHDVVRLAFGDIVRGVESATGLLAFRGTPPTSGAAS